MLKKINRLMIIPARGGSKRIKNKNIKLFKSKPIIYYPIKEIIKSKLFKTIHVSTDSKKVFNVINRIKKNITFFRPKKLATDRAPLFNVYKKIVNFYTLKNELYDEIWFLTPCSPLIRSKDLIKAAKIFEKQKNNSLLSVSKYSPPIEWAFKIKKNTLIPNNNKNQKIMSQFLEDHYFDTGNFGIFSSDVFYKNKKITFCPYILPKSKAVDIDDIDDWNLALKLSN
jgi:CMP-N-acetylneuraminic acid synthetase